MPFLPADWESTMRPALVAWAEGVLGSTWTVYWAGQDAPAPPDPRALLSILAAPSGTGGPTRSTIETVPGLVERISYQAEFTLSVSLRGAGAEQLFAGASALELSHARTAVVDAMDAAGLTALRCQGVKQLDAVIGGRWERQAVVDFDFAAEVRSDVDLTEWFETALLGIVTAPGITGTVGG